MVTKQRELTNMIVENVSGACYFWSVHQPKSQNVCFETKEFHQEILEPLRVDAHPDTERRTSITYFALELSSNRSFLTVNLAAT